MFRQIQKPVSRGGAQQMYDTTHVLTHDSGWKPLQNVPQLAFQLLVIRGNVASHVNDLLAASLNPVPFSKKFTLTFC